MIDAVLYINLDHRTDRKTHILNQLSRMQFSESIIHRIPAIYNSECGHIGCGQSHIKALQYALIQGWDEVLILEDDFKFLVSREVMDAYLAEAVVPWDVFLLAKGNGTYEEPVGHIQKVKRCTTTSGYIVRRHYIEVLLENFTQSLNKMRQQLIIHQERKPDTKFIHGVFAIDQSWSSLQKKDKFYITEPVIGTQNKSLKSDTF